MGKSIGNGAREAIAYADHIVKPHWNRRMRHRI